jgi:hypothetical protein
LVVPPDTQFQPNISKDGAPGLGPMSKLGQNRKSSMRAHVFRFAPKTSRNRVGMSVSCQHATSTNAETANQRTKTGRLKASAQFTAKQ